MDLRKLQRTIVDALDDIKAQDIQVFNTTGLTDLFDRVILATGNSNRQTRSLASHVREKVKQNGGDVISVEGEETGEWVLVDLGDAVVHIMQPAIRAYYNLEELWGGKPVRLKMAAVNASRARHAQAIPDWDPNPGSKPLMASSSTATRGATGSGRSAAARRTEAAARKTAGSAATPRTARTSAAPEGPAVKAARKRASPAAATAASKARISGRAATAGSGRAASASSSRAATTSSGRSASKSTSKAPAARSAARKTRAG